MEANRIDQGVAMSWGKRFNETRRRLIESHDFENLRDVGHELKDGVVLTSVGDMPFEMSFKCTLCGKAFWFENPASDTGGIAQWRFSQETSEAAKEICAAPGRIVRRIPVDQRGTIHP
jgi:hypothetical protein